jgi:pimeloyl-ACP methyl ester carboxylesterase
MANDPDAFGERVARRLAADHGEDYWRTVLRFGGRAWLDIAATPTDDLYDHRLGALRVPLLVVHGVNDPRTEPGELDRLRRDVPAARLELIAGAGHSPHSEPGSAVTSTALVAEFLASTS